MSAKRILIVDDDPDIITILTQRLKTTGYEIFAAQDGEEAIVKAKEEKPDLIIMDVLMPKMTGYEALRRIREESDLKKVPAIVISAKGVMKDFFTNLPHVEFMAKPYNMQEFSDKIEQLIAATGTSGAVKSL